MTVDSINFFMPVQYGGEKTWMQHIEEGVEDYFYLDGKKAYVIPGSVSDDNREVKVEERDQGTFKQVVLGAIKVISYITVVIPLIMLIAKAAFRAAHEFHTATVKDVENPDSEDKKTSKLGQSSLGTQPAKSGTTNNRANASNAVAAIPAGDFSLGESKLSFVASGANLEGSELTFPPFEAGFSESAEKELSAGSSARTADAVAVLMDKFTKSWNQDNKEFDFASSSFDLSRFTDLLSDHTERFKKENINNEEHFGYIEKFDLDPSQNPQIYMRADLHGDLKSLIENLRSLQQQGLLDENFKCRPGVHLVFLGNYCDCGKHGTQILEMLMRLREENPQQVHLIRGNHEYIRTNEEFGSDDQHLMQVISDKKAGDALERFYETMSLTTYFSVNGEGQRDYVQCTHGLFELTMDPAPLLDQQDSGRYLPVPKARKLSERICKIANSNSELARAAKRVNEMVENSTWLDSLFTAYNWAAVSESRSSYGPLGYSHYALSAQDIRHYLDLSSEQHRVMMLFRGHEHAFQHLMHEGQVLATTLPIGMDCPEYKKRFNQPDRAYIIIPQAQVAKWEKRAILREMGHEVSDEITNQYLLTSACI